MIRFYFLAIFATLVLVACPSQKKNGKETVIDTPKDTTTKVINMEKETATELDELVYEGIGASVLKKESLARSQAELKGRKEVIRILAEDANQLIQLFIQEQPGFFSSDVNSDDFGKSIEKEMNAATTLKGCKISEYSQSDNKDTTFASMEIGLMGGYDVIESAVISTGLQKKYLTADKTNSFKKSFKEFFTVHKKKMLTKPA